MTLTSPPPSTKPSSTPAAAAIRPSEVHSALQRHMLVDGYDIVLDLERSHGPYLHDAREGRELLDFFTSFSTVPLGYNHPVFSDPDLRERLLRAAINKPANSDLYTTDMAQFVGAFARTLPEQLSGHLFFISGGALAVENAMKAAFDWKRRKNADAGRGDHLGRQIIHLRDAFHGRSGYTMSVTNTDPAKVRYFPKFEWPRVENPHLSFPVTDRVLEEVEAAERRSIAQIEQALVDHRHDIAGLLIEPIQGEGGDNHFRAEYLRKLRELADEGEFLLLFDEVQTGFGATGRWWCHEHFDVVPDVMAFGKKTQICGIAASRRLDEVDSVFEVSSRINSTWGGNLVDMIRSRAIVETVERDGLLEQVSTVGEVLKQGLERIAASSDGRVTNVRGRGFFLALDLPSRETRDKALDAMLEQDLLGLASGRRSVRFRPPLILDRETAEIGLERIERALHRVLD